MRIWQGLYRYLSQHKMLCWMLLVCLCCGFLALMLRIDYKEDISDFLPLDETHSQHMALWQDLAEAEKIIVIFENTDTLVDADILCDALDMYANYYDTRLQTEVGELTTQIDLQTYLDVIDWTYQHIPYFLTEKDYARMDSLMQQPDFIAQQVQSNKLQLLSPISSFIASRIQQDPLNLFEPTIQGLRQFQPSMSSDSQFEMYDGYLLTTDQRMALAFLNSPYGASETQQNSRLIDELNALSDSVMNAYPTLSVRLLGSPVIAVENAKRIKLDSIITIALALLLIGVLLFRSFARKRDILLIALTIVFGWLFGMAVLSLFTQSVSMIVLGIGSIIIGIAVNYPLHVLKHRQFTADTETTMREELSPLIIGNITTVSAFLTLLPLQATALRQLGIFCAAMLVGTIIFTIVFLPQMMTSSSPVVSRKSYFTILTTWQPEKSNWLVGLCLLLTVVFGYFSRDLSFDANMSHINYMTAQQRADFAQFATLQGAEKNHADVYVVSDGATWEEAYQELETLQPIFDSLQVTDAVANVRQVVTYLPSPQEQAKRLAMWEQWRQRWGERIIRTLRTESMKQGFRAESCQHFESLFTQTFNPQDFAFFAPLTEQMLHTYYQDKTDNFTIVSYLHTPNDKVQNVEATLHHRTASTAFDIPSLSGQIAKSLSNNFNYIGIACSLIVFLFLWLSFKRFWIAVVAFLPMAISWIWILGLMHIFGLQFNIVNVILATFIFGQGDDYTIFITEGLLYEHKTGKTILPQYKSEIMLSALIMFIGIGVLVLAKHPAMFSLGAVTLIGMASVVLMAYLLPPLCFRVLKHFKYI